MGKRMILEQGREGTKPAYKQNSLLGRWQRKKSAGSFDYKTASLSRGCFSAQDDNFEKVDQLPSLLARFQEISSPMVELVLETGCL